MASRSDTDHPSGAGGNEDEAPPPSPFRPAPPELVDVLRRALGNGWNLTRAWLTPGGFAADCRDASGAEYRLEGRRKRDGQASFVAGELLALSHGGSSAEWDEVHLQGYRTALGRLAAAEAAIEPLLLDEIVDAPSQPPAAMVFYREQELSLRLLFAPRGRSLRRALRAILAADLPAGAPAEIQVYFQHRCAQACQFCEQPRRRDEISGRAMEFLLGAQRLARLDLVSRGVFDLLLAEAEQRDPPAAVQITGNDWAMHPALDALLAAVERHPEVRVSFCGPSTRLADRALAQRVASLPGLARVILTLESPSPEVHDAIVGAPGSGAQVLAAIDSLRAVGAPLAVNVVLTAAAVEALPATLAWLTARELRADAQAFIPDRGLGKDGDAFTPRADAIFAALQKAGSDAAFGLARIHGVPLCAVPAALRDRLDRAQSTQERQPAAYPPACDRCRDRPSCSGVPASYVRRHGGAGLTPALRCDDLA